jgi:HTH-type transcriptional regulator / antitoxin HigA
MLHSVHKKITDSWIKNLNILKVPHSEKDYLKLSIFLDDLIDESEGKENHKLSALIDTIGILMENYEEENYKIPDTEPNQVLKFLLEANNLSQKDLLEVGSQGVVSELLNGKRKLNVRQIKLLSLKFHISADALI